MSAHNINELCLFYKKESSLDLFYSIAVGALDLRDLKEIPNTAGKLHTPFRDIKNDIKGLTPEEVLTSTNPPKGTELIIFGEHSDKVLYKLAACCQPIPGDDVFGFVTAGEGLKIHRADCPNAPQLLAHYGHRVIKTKWAKNKEITFLAGIRIVGLDDVGIIQKITNIVSGDLKINMSSMSIDTKEGLFDGSIKVFVHDREELDVLCDRLSRIQDIHTVERIEQKND